MRFRDIIGHGQEIEKLVTMADNGRIPHALLLHGPSGVGKTRVARAFVQYLFCSERHDGDSCGRCPACLQASSLGNPDIHYIFPIVKKDKNDTAADFAEEWLEFMERSPYMSPEEWLDIIEAGNSRPMIHVTESEELLRQSSLSAYGDGRKVFVIWLPEKMNPDASNRLLKVIEEPFEDTLFILISNSPAEILPTVRSRLQGLEFRPLPDEDIAGFLRSAGKSAEEAEVLAGIAKGNMNRAAALVAEDGEYAAFAAVFMGVMRAAYARRMPELREYADTFAGYGREKAMRLLIYFARMVRESFISNLSCPSLETMTPSEKTFVGRFGPFINVANMEELLSQIDRAREDISRNANQKIVWFDFLVELTRLIRSQSAPQSKK